MRSRCDYIGLVLTVLATLLGTPFGSADQEQGAARSVTFPSLLNEMTDLEALSRMPNPAYSCKQFSSYDRHSTDPSDVTEQNWFANGDRGHYLREEERNGAKEYVLMDAEGPGVIVRIWSANPQDAGTVRIYLDGAAEPAIEMLLAAMLEGKHDIFPAPIAHTLARGWNSYLPIPYAKHCKVTASKPDFYYHINYRTYAPDTKVTTFTIREAEADKDHIHAVAKALADSENAFTPPTNALTTASYEITANPGERAEIATLKGPAAIYRLTMDVEAADLDAALRGALLEFTVDQETAPSVLAPLGDFFGTAPGLNRFQSLPCGVREDGTSYSHWVMPYRYAATLRIVNHSKQSVTIRGQLVAGAREWTSDSLYFHAKWRGVQNLRTFPHQDWNFLTARGRGRFVGCMLHVTNPVPNWWGEGDEKIYVDNEPFPSHFGTGSEDYFGYAWCAPEVFTNAYHNQPRVDGPANFGHTCVSRFHIVDNIPFDRAFKFDMEIMHWADCEISQSVVAYWYADASATDDFTKPASEALVVPAIPETRRVEGALEGEDLNIISKTAGEARTQETRLWNWSGAKQLWWTDAKPGDTLVLGFSVDHAGRYTIYAAFTKAPDYGIAQLAINGEKLGDPRDFYHSEVMVTPEFALGVCDLKTGDNQLEVTLTGADPVAEPKYMFGLDYLLLRPAE